MRIRELDRILLVAAVSAFAGVLVASQVFPAKRVDAEIHAVEPPASIVRR